MMFLLVFLMFQCFSTFDTILTPHLANDVTGRARTVCRAQHEQAQRRSCAQARFRHGTASGVRASRFDDADVAARHS